VEVNFRLAIAKLNLRIVHLGNGELGDKGDKGDRETRETKLFEWYCVFSKIKYEFIFFVIKLYFARNYIY